MADMRSFTLCENSMTMSRMAAMPAARPTFMEKSHESTYTTNMRAITNRNIDMTMRGTFVDVASASLRLLIGRSRAKRKGDMAARVTAAQTIRCHGDASISDSHGIRYCRATMVMAMSIIEYRSVRQI